MNKHALCYSNKANTTPVKGAIRSAITSWIQHRWAMIDEKWTKKCNGCEVCSRLMNDVIENQVTKDSNIVPLGDYN